jgi:hypothetical protein
MILLLIIFAWVLVLLTVVSLCAAAQIGDRQRQAAPPAQLAWEAQQTTIIARRSAEEAIAAASHASDSLARTAA